MRHPDWAGLEVTLSVAGADLKEYDEENDDISLPDASTPIVQYVEAVPGANFTVNVCVDKTFKHHANAIAAYVFLDGRSAVGKFVEPLGWEFRTRRTFSGAENCVGGRWQFSKFAFAELATDDGRPEAHLKEKLANLGEVSVKFYRVKKAGSHEASKREFEPTVSSAGVPEKALKGRAISSYATLGKGEPIAPVKHTHVEYPWGTKPVATFTFKYRSRRDLQIEGIIPRDPTPVPLEERDPDTLTPGEALELIRIQRQKLQDQTKIKKEKKEKRGREEDDGQEDDGEVTMTGEQRKRQRLSNDSGIEVIDLSNEDDEDDDRVGEQSEHISLHLSGEMRFLSDALLATALGGEWDVLIQKCAGIFERHPSVLGVLECTTSTVISMDKVHPHMVQVVSGDRSRKHA